MKKTSKFLVVAILIITMSVLLMACTEKDADGLIKLSTPTNVTVSGDSISWDAVENASKYFVLVEGEQTEFETSKTSYKLSISQVGTYSVQVRAYGDGEKYGTSDYSEVVKFIKGATLPQPVVSVDGTGKVSWKAVESADSYNVLIKNRDNKLVKQFNTKELTYNCENDADKELFKNPNAYKVTVQALPNPEDKTHRASLESEVVKYLKRGKLNTPTFNSITSTTIWWNKVDKDIKAYDSTLVVKYEIKLEYTDAEGNAKQETYLSTNDNMGIANFKLPVAGEYKTSIRAVGDEVYENSDWSAVDPNYSLIKLPQIAKDKITFTKSGLNGKLEWDVESIDNIGRFNVILETYKADGTKALTSSEYVAVREEGEGDSKTPVLHYSYDVMEMFYKQESTTERPQAIKNDDEYYGRTYKVSIMAVRDSAGTTEANRVIESDKTTLDETYSNYIKPIVVGRGDVDYYLIDTMSKFAYIKEEPDKNYTIEANIDFRGYPVNMIPNFSGIIAGNNYTLKNMVIVSPDTDPTNPNRNIALFDNLTGSVSDLFINNFKLSYDHSANRAAVLAAENNGKIQNVYVVGDAVAHQFNKEIKDEDKIVANTVGGLVAVNNGEIDDCVANVKVEGNVVGGLVGINSNAIYNSYALGEVTAKHNNKVAEAQNIYAGGLVAENKKVGETPVLIMSSFADNKVKANSNVAVDTVRAGGLISINGAECEIRVSYSGAMFTLNNVDKVEVVSSGKGSVTGGFVADNQGTIIDTYTTLKAVGTSMAAGFAGINSGKIENAYCAGGVGNNGTVGGFVADNLETGVVTNAYYVKPNTSFVAREGEQGTLVENKNIDTLNEKMGPAFAKFEENPAPILKGMVYVSEYNLKTKSGAVNPHVARIFETVENGKEIKIYSDENFKDPDKKVSFSYVCGNEKDAEKKGNTIRARYTYVGVSIQVLVTIK